MKRLSNPERKVWFPLPAGPGRGREGAEWEVAPTFRSPLTLTLSRGYTGEGTGRRALATVLLAASTLAGCAAKPDPIPRYTGLDTDAALATLRERTAALKNVRGEATIKLTNAKGESVNLDGAFVLAKPERARLRAWKFGQAVFDLTIDGEKAWAYLPREEAKPAVPGLRQSLGRWLALLSDGDGLFEGQAVERGGEIRVARPEGDGVVCCAIDAATLTPRQYTLIDGRGQRRFRLVLSEYRPAADGQVWPSMLFAESETGTVEVRMRDVETNTDIDPAAFKPPARAEALP